MQINNWLSPIVSGKFYTWDGFILCLPGDTLQVLVQNATLNDDLYSHVMGYSIALNL